MPDISHILRRYREVEFINCDLGYIIWRRGTGDNVELLDIKAQSPGQGNGRQLFYMMLDMLHWHKPYHSIFGFTRTCNTRAQKFYKSLGFELQTVIGPYQDGDAVLFCAPYEKLVSLKPATGWEP